MQYLGIELANWFNVGVQIFLCMSGYLYGQRHIEDDISFYLKQIKKILVPYYVVLVPVIIIRMLFFPEEGFGCIRVIGILLVHSTFSGGGHLWFVPSVLMCYILTPLMERWFGRIDHKPLFLLTEMMLIFAVVFGFFYTYFNPATISCYLIGYFLGRCLAMNLQKEYRFVAFTVAAFSLMNMGQIFTDYVLRIEFTGKLGTIYGYWRNYNHVWLGITIFIVLKWLFDRGDSYPLWLRKAANIIDDYSYEGYLIHHFMILGPMTLMALTTNVVVNIIVILILIAILTYAAKKLVLLIMKKL